MKKLTMMILSIIICLILMSCGNSTRPIAEAVEARTVVKIDIATIPEDNEYSRHYSDLEKIEAICSYIRGLTWSDIEKEDVDKETGAEYIVTYVYDDDTTRTYYFKEEGYFRTDGFDWKRIGYLSELKELIKNTDTD